MQISSSTEQTPTTSREIPQQGITTETASFATRKLSSLKSYTRQLSDASTSTSETTGNKKTQARRVTFSNVEIIRYPLSENENAEKLEHIQEINKNKDVRALEANLEQEHEILLRVYDDKYGKEKETFKEKAIKETSLKTKNDVEADAKLQKKLASYEANEADLREKFKANLEKSAQIKLQVAENIKEALHAARTKKDINSDKYDNAVEDYNESVKRYNKLTIAYKNSKEQAEKLVSALECYQANDMFESSEQFDKAEQKTNKAIDEYEKLESKIKAFKKQCDDKNKMITFYEDAVEHHEKKIEKLESECAQQMTKKTKKQNAYIGSRITYDDVEQYQAKQCDPQPNDPQTQIATTSQKFEEETPSTVSTAHKDQSEKSAPDATTKLTGKDLLNQAIASSKITTNSVFDPQSKRILDGKKLLSGEYTDLKDICINTCIALFKELEQNSNISKKNFKIKLATIEFEGDDPVLHSKPDDSSIPDLVANSYLVFEDRQNKTQYIFDPMISSIIPGLKPEILTPAQLLQNIVDRIEANPTVLADTDLGCWIPGNVVRRINRFTYGNNHSAEACQYIAGLLFDGMYGQTVNPAHKMVESSSADIVGTSRQTTHHSTAKSDGSQENIADTIKAELDHSVVEHSHHKDDSSPKTATHDSGALVPYTPEKQTSNIVAKKNQGKLGDNKAVTYKKSIAMKSISGLLTDDFKIVPDSQETKIVKKCIGFEAGTSNPSALAKPVGSETHAVAGGEYLSIRKLPKNKNKALKHRDERDSKALTVHSSSPSNPSSSNKLSRYKANLCVIDEEARVANGASTSGIKMRSVQGDLSFKVKRSKLGAAYNLINELSAAASPSGASALPSTVPLLTDQPSTSKTKQLKASSHSHKPGKHERPEASRRDERASYRHSERGESALKKAKDPFPWMQCDRPKPEAHAKGLHGINLDESRCDLTLRSYAMKQSKTKAALLARENYRIQKMRELYKEWIGQQTLEEASAKRIQRAMSETTAQPSSTQRSSAQVVQRSYSEPAAGSSKNTHHSQPKNFTSTQQYTNRENQKKIAEQERAAQREAERMHREAEYQQRREDKAKEQQRAAQREAERMHREAEYQQRREDKAKEQERAAQREAERMHREAEYQQRREDEAKEQQRQQEEAARLQQEAVEQEQRRQQELAEEAEENLRMAQAAEENERIIQQQQEQAEAAAQAEQDRLQAEAAAQAEQDRLQAEADAAQQRLLEEQSNQSMASTETEFEFYWCSAKYTY